MSEPENHRKNGLLRPLFRDFVFHGVRLFNSLSRSMARLLRLPYQLVLPYSTYAPWLQDEEFQSTYRSVQEDCLVDIYQCWELWTQARQSDLVEGDVLEVGVWRGGSSAILASALRSVGSMSKLFCCDSFSGLVKTGLADPHNRDGELSNTDADFVEERLSRLGLDNFEILVGVFPDETGERLEEKRFSLCHIDVDTRQSAEDIFLWVWPRMNPGGVLIFQDYGFHRTPGITEFVNSLKGESGLNVVHNLNGNALVFKLA